MVLLGMHVYSSKTLYFPARCDGVGVHAFLTRLHKKAEEGNPGEVNQSRIEREAKHHTNPPVHRDATVMAVVRPASAGKQ